MSTPFLPERRRLAVLAAALMLGAAATPAWASRKKSRKKTGEEKMAGQTEPQRPGKAKFYRGSEETVSERERRLYRECQGRPNAGACAGYAR